MANDKEDSMKANTNSPEGPPSVCRIQRPSPRVPTEDEPLHDRFLMKPLSPQPLLLSSDPYLAKSYKDMNTVYM